MNERQGRTDGNFPWWSLAVGLSSLIAMLIMVIFSGIRDYLAPFEHFASDWRVAHLSPRLPGLHPKLAIVSINDDLISDLKITRSPLDRGMLANLVRAIDSAGPCVIGLDLFFPWATANDEELLVTLRRAKAKVILGAADERYDMPYPSRLQQTRFIRASGKDAGFLNLNQDDIDGVVRRHPSAGYQSEFPFSFSYLVAKASDLSVSVPETRRIGWLNVPSDGGVTFLTIPAQSLFSAASTQHDDDCSPDGQTTQESLRNRIVLVGVQFNEDRHRTPFSRWEKTAGSPGVVIHTQMTADILGGKAREVWDLNSTWQQHFLMGLSVAGFLLGLWLWRAGVINFLSWGMATLTLVAADMITFRFSHLVLPFGAALLTWFFAVNCGRSLRKLAVYSMTQSRPRTPS